MYKERMNTQTCMFVCFLNFNPFRNFMKKNTIIQDTPSFNSKIGFLTHNYGVKGLCY